MYEIRQIRNLTTNITYLADYTAVSHESLNPLKYSGIRWLHFKVFSAIQI